MPDKIPLIAWPQHKSVVTLSFLLDEVNSWWISNGMRGEKPLSSQVKPREADPPLSTKALESSYVLFLATLRTPPSLHAVGHHMALHSSRCKPEHLQHPASPTLALQHTTSDTVRLDRNFPPLFGLCCTALHPLEMEIHKEWLRKGPLRTHIHPQLLHVFKTLIQQSFISYKLFPNSLWGN